MIDRMYDPWSYDLCQCFHDNYHSTRQTYNRMGPILWICSNLKLPSIVPKYQYIFKTHLKVRRIEIEIKSELIEIMFPIICIIVSNSSFIPDHFGKLSHDPYYIMYKIVIWLSHDRLLCDKVQKFMHDLILWHSGRFPWWIFISSFTSRICQIVASFILISINFNSTVFYKIHINRLRLGKDLFHIKNVHTAK